MAFKAFLVIEYPPIFISPDVDFKILVIIFINVDLPAPLGPISPNISPSWILKFILSKTNLSLNLFVTLFTSIMLIKKPPQAF